MTIIFIMAMVIVIMNMIINSIIRTDVTANLDSPVHLEPLVHIGWGQDPPVQI